MCQIVLKTPECHRVLLSDRRLAAAVKHDSAYSAKFVDERVRNFGCAYAVPLPSLMMDAELKHISVLKTF